MEMEQVRFEGKLYTVIYKYTSGYWEIKEMDNRFNIQLVHQSEVQPVL